MVNGGRSQRGIGFKRSYMRNSFWKRNSDILLYLSLFVAVIGIVLYALLGGHE